MRKNFKGMLAIALSVSMALPSGTAFAAPAADVSSEQTADVSPSGSETKGLDSDESSSDDSGSASDVRDDSDSGSKDEGSSSSDDTSSEGSSDDASDADTDDDSDSDASGADDDASDSDDDASGSDDASGEDKSTDDSDSSDSSSDVKDDSDAADDSETADDQDDAKDQKDENGSSDSQKENDSKSTSDESASNAKTNKFTFNEEEEIILTDLDEEKTEYSVSFEAGADATGTPETVTESSIESEIEITLPTTAPKRSGYTFKGWATEEDGDVVYAAGDKITVKSEASSVTLYAVWGTEAINYTISFTADDAEGVSNMPDAVTVSSTAAEATVEIPGKKPRREGYTFAGWATEDGSKTYSTFARVPMTSADSSITLHATWGEECIGTLSTAVLYVAADGSSYTTGDEGNVTVHCDRGTKGHDNSHNSYRADIWSAITGKYNIDTDKYDILGITNYKSANDSVRITAGDTRTYSYGDEDTFYLKVKEKKEYSISFSAGDVEGVSNLPDTLTERSTASEVEIILPYYDKNPSREGYGFIGWATEAGGSVVYTQANKVTLTAENSNITLYAVWGDECKANVTSAVLYIDADGSFETSETASLTFDCTMGGAGHGIGNHKISKQELIASMKDKFNVDTDKYEILGISTSAPSAKPGIWIKPDETGTVSNSFSKTCYLVVKEKKEYSISFSAGDVEGVSNLPETITERSNESEVKIILPYYEKNPSREGYGFIGWATEAGGSVVYTQANKVTLTAENSNITLYAVWGDECKADVTSAVLYIDADGNYKESETAILTFDCTMGGAGHGIGNHKISKQELIASIADKFNVDTDKYEILGISTSAPSAKPGIWIKPDETGVVSNSFSKTCYLVVKAGVQKAYTVSFNGGADDASGVPETVTKNSIKSEVDITLPTTTPSRSGYSFKGWATEEGGSAAYAAGAEITVKSDASSVTLYAVWEKDADPVTPEVKVNYTISFNAGTGATGAPKAVTVSSTDKEVKITLPTTVPSRSGYSFKGWATEEGGSAAYAAGAEITVKSDANSVTLYAVWEKNADPVNPVNPSKPDSGKNGSTRNSSGRTGSSSGSGAGTSSAVIGSWRHNGDNSWNYVLTGGSLATGWRDITGTAGTAKYHFESNGVMDTGWYRETSTVWYYLETSGAREGAAVGGWLNDPQDGNTYYLDTDSKIMALGWKQIGGKWYYFNQNVPGISGWSYEGEKWVYSEGNTLPLGAMLKNTTTPDGYQVGADGAWIQ